MKAKKNGSASRSGFLKTEIVKRLPAIKKAVVFAPFFLSTCHLPSDALNASSVTAEANTPINASVRVYFSPNGGAEKAICEAMDKAKKEIRVQAYLLSSRAVTDAIIRAHQRGVDTQVILDKKVFDNKKNTASEIAAAGVPIFADGKHSTSHDKIVVTDKACVLTGSFNYVDKAETKNSENLLVLESAELADQYLKHWNEHQRHAKPVKAELQ